MDNEIVIGKRVTVGAMITSLAGVLAHFYPEHSPAIIGAAVPITFIVQVIIANKLGVTTNANKD